MGQARDPAIPKYARAPRDAVLVIDAKLMAGGIAALAAGLALSAYLAAAMPVGTPGMEEDEALRLVLEQRENRDFGTLAALMSGVGLLLILVSLGARRGRRGAGAARKKKQAPAA